MLEFGSPEAAEMLERAEEQEVFRRFREGFDEALTVMWEIQLGHAKPIANDYLAHKIQELLDHLDWSNDRSKVLGFLIDTAEAHRYLPDKVWEWRKSHHMLLELAKKRAAELDKDAKGGNDANH